MSHIPQRILSERLAQLPQDKHVTIKEYDSSYGIYYRAFWHETIHGKRISKSLYLGKDDETGTIAAMIAQQKTYKHHPVEGQVLVRDELGKPVYLDEAMAAIYFLPPLAKIIHVRDGRRYVVDHSQDDKSGHPKYVPLTQWIWEACYGREVTKGYEIVQKVAGTDYTINNLPEVRKAKNKEDAA